MPSSFSQPNSGSSVMHFFPICIYDGYVANQTSHTNTRNIGDPFPIYSCQEIILELMNTALKLASQS